VGVVTGILTPTDHPSVLEVLRRRRIARQRRQHQIRPLGPGWRVLGVPSARSTAPEYLTIGPGGIFLVAVVYQGRIRARVAGDVLQLVTGPRSNIGVLRDRAQRVSVQLSTRAGVAVPVQPVLALSGLGVVDVYGLPRGIVVATGRDLSDVLNGYGERLAPQTVDKLYTLAVGRRAGAVRMRAPAATVSPRDASRIKELRPNPLLLTAAVLLPAEYRAEYVEWWQSTLADETVRTPWQRIRLIGSLLSGAPAQAVSLWSARRQALDR
jgi:hypothetical protein